MPLTKSAGAATLILLRGDITDQEVDAIVNAANSSLMGGGGVDGAIHRAGGPRIHEECLAIRSSCGDCQPGKAVITSGGNLKARHVIHTVGPVWHGGTQGEDDTLASAYRSSLALAASRALHTVAFPSISTGAYGFPLERASLIALDTVTSFLKSDTSIQEVRFVVYSQSDYEIYARLF
ncbi:MAG TPA: O-acetyl-ADP-ribose deacetylase [Bacteroidota bacterium]|nr:O-acetyl-ADP-ribose deacetylase [Bacteroidota bacterium]